MNVVAEVRFAVKHAARKVCLGMEPRVEIRHTPESPVLAEVWLEDDTVHVRYRAAYLDAAA